MKKMMIRARYGVAALALMAGMMVAQPASALKLTLSHWGAAFYPVPSAVAVSKGFYKARGIDITALLTASGGGTGVRNMIASDFPMGEVPLTAVIEAARSGLKLKVVAEGCANIGDVVWVVAKDSPLKTLQDLKGKRMGFTRPGSVTQSLATLMLDKAGLKKGDVTLVSIGEFADNVTAVLSGGLDAGVVAEPIWTMNEDKVRALAWATDYLPARMNQTVVVTTEEFAKAHPDVVRNALAARLEGVRFVYAHPDEAAAIIQNAYSVPPEKIVEVLRHLVALKYWDEGKFDIPSMQRMVEGLRLIGSLPPGDDWQKLLDPSFLPADVQD